MNEESVMELLRKYNGPLRREKMTMAKFLEGHYKEYIKSLQTLVYDEKSSILGESLYEIINEKISNIDSTCKDVVKILELCDQGKMEVAHEKFNKLMERLEDIIIKTIFVSSLNGLYRIRSGSKNDNFGRMDLFHISFNQRENINAYRFSIAGYPSLYLGETIDVCWFECGMPKSFYVSQYELNIINKRERIIGLDNCPDNYLILVDLSTKPFDLISNAIIKTEDTKKMILEYICLYPLIIACSCVTKNKDVAFIEEYTISQLLCLWVKNHAKIDGIRYQTISRFDDDQDINNKNIVLPAKKIDEFGFCGRLKDYFKISKPVYRSLRESFNEKVCQEKAEQIQKLFNDLNSGDYKKIRRRDSLFENIFMLCKNFIDVYNCIVSEQYLSPEVLYSNMNTLNLYARSLNQEFQKRKDNGDLFNQVYSIDTGFKKEELKKNINKIFIDFETVVSDIKVFENYSTYINNKNDIGESCSFEYIQYDNDH